MSGHLALDARIADTVFARIGAAGTYTTADDESVAVRAIVDEETLLQGELGSVIDPRPSVTLDRRIVGDAPRGVLVVGDRRWRLDRPVDAGDRYEVRVYLRPERDE